MLNAYPQAANRLHDIYTEGMDAQEFSEETDRIFGQLIDDTESGMLAAKTAVNSLRSLPSVR